MSDLVRLLSCPAWNSTFTLVYSQIKAALTLKSLSNPARTGIHSYSHCPSTEGLSPHLGVKNSLNGLILVQSTCHTLSALSHLIPWESSNPSCPQDESNPPRHTLPDLISPSLPFPTCPFTAAPSQGLHLPGGLHPHVTHHPLDVSYLASLLRALSAAVFNLICGTRHFPRSPPPGYELPGQHLSYLHPQLLSTAPTIQLVLKTFKTMLSSS